MMPGGEGRVRCPRARPHQPRSRAVRASCLPALRPVCGVRRWKWASGRRSDPRPLDGFAHEAWPGSHQGTTHPLARAVVERRQASAPDSGRAAQADPSVARPHPFGAGLTTVRLPAFRFLLFYFVARVSVAKPGSGIEAYRSSPDFAPLHPGYDDGLFDIAV